MKILLTGASSFTGYWFAKTLADAGHQVVAPLRGKVEDATDTGRGRRLRLLHGTANLTLIEDCRFGSPQFLAVARDGNYDLLCLHHAKVGDYHNPAFDIAAAVADNTHNLREVLDCMRHDLKGVVLTGTFFEHDEGAGTQPLVAFSPYAVSKGLTAQVVLYRCYEARVPFGKFVIPHPFGPLEQPRLGHYLAKTWRDGGVAEIATPHYVRDNIHVSLLAACYRRFVEEAPYAPPFRKLNPSGYVESQGAFVHRLAREIRRRLAWECRTRLLPQADFSQPMVRINTDIAIQYAPDWDEQAAWDSYAKAYASDT